MRFDEAIHDTVSAMVADVRALPPGFTSEAIARGRRLRLRRRLATAAGAVAAVIAVLLPFALLRGPDGHHQAPATSSSPSSLASRSSPSALASRTASPPARPSGPALVGGWRVVAAGRVALDSTGKYVKLPSSGRILLPAPAGHRFLIEAGPVQVTEVSGGRLSTVDTRDLIGELRWSPTGDRLVSAYLRKDSAEMGFAIIDARTGTVTRHPVDHQRYDCSQCTYSFTRDGREVVLALADRSGGEAADRVLALQFFTAATGAPSRLVNANTWVPASPYAFSPDGRYLIAESDSAPGEYVRFDLTTGVADPFPSAAVWVTDDDLLAAEGLDVLTLRKDGTRSARTTLTIPDAGTPIVFGPPD